METVYLDNNATAPISSWVRDAIGEYLVAPGANPSSPHGPGEAALRWLESSRLTIAEALNVEDRQLLFTSSGTEANNMVVFTGAQLSTENRNVIVTTNVEHDSILSSCERLNGHGVEVRYLPVDVDGVIVPEAIPQVIDEHCALVSVQWVNNETGIIQPIENIVRRAREVGALVHTDAAQALGRFPIDLEAADIDFATITGHKLHAPGGVGAVYAKRPSHLLPFMAGGDQENGRRPGTHNLMGIVGFAAAVEHRIGNLNEPIFLMGELRNSFERGLGQRIPGLRIVGQDSPRVCNTSNIIFPDITDGQAFYAQVVDSGVACSQASACHSRRPEPSHVLRAMNYTEDESFRAMRFSLSVLNFQSEVDEAVARIGDVWDRLKEPVGTRKAAGAMI